VHVKTAFPRCSQKRLRVFLLLIPLFLIITTNQATAFNATVYYAEDKSTVKAAPVTLSGGTIGECLVSSTRDYASVTATAGLRLIENADLLVPPQAVSPSIDGSGIAQFTLATTGSCTVTTTKANDVIYVAVAILGTAATSSLTGSSGSQLTLRGAISNPAGVRCETWYQVASNPGAQTVTVSFDAATTFALIVFGVKDANLPNPFDLTSGNPMTGIGMGSTQAVTVGSTLSNTLVLGSVAVMGSATPNAGSGLVRIQRSNSGGLGEAAVYKSLKTVDYTLAYTTTSIYLVNWAMVGDVIWGKLPALTVDTGFVEPSTGGSKDIANSKEGYLVSPAYPQNTVINAGVWQLNLWAAAQTADEELQLMLLVTDSQYNILNDVCSRRASGPIPDSPTLVTLDCEQPQVVVPAGGHLVIVISNNAGSSPFTVYWGTQGLTNFITTRESDYILRVDNRDSATVNVDFSVASYSSIARLSNLTLYVYSPISTCIKVTDGALTQSASSPIAIAGTSTLYLSMNATATNFDSLSNIVILLRFSPSAKPFTYDVINLTVK
jgi:hypothetical protein